MELEKNPKTRPLYKKLLSIIDKASGKAFPKMKRVKQITSSHCGPAVLESLFSFVGMKVSQRGMVRSIRAGKKIRRLGLSIKDLSRAVAIVGKREFTFWKKENSKVSDLAKILTKYKYPVGVEWQGVFYEYEDEDSGHYGVVTDVDLVRKTIRISDPFPEFSGVDRKFPLSFFTKRWWDKNLIKRKMVTDKKMIFVITPKNQIWPKDLGMKRVGV